MDLLERYLGAVARHLPEAQRADVTAELRDALLSDIEAEETRLGRPQTREELEALLIRFGHPLTVSGRYRKTQHLIGPEVYPFWWAGLKAALMIVGGIYLVLVLLIIFSGEEAEAVVKGATPSLTEALVVTFGVVTLVCMLIERFGKTALLARWRPRNLPPARNGTKSKFELAVDIGMAVVFLLWWTGLVHFRNSIPGIPLQVTLAPVWAAWFWPILLCGVFDLGVSLLAFIRPGLARLVHLLRLISNLAAAAVLTAVYQAGHWLVLTSPAWTPEVLATTSAHFDRGMRVGILSTITVFLVLAGVSLWQLRRREEGPHALSSRAA
jgi:hypothetical protein